MSLQAEWESLSDEIKQSSCGQLFGDATCVIGRGSLNCRVVFIGEAPGAEEDKQGLAFVGRSGKLLDEWISYLDVEDEYYITNVVKCRPPNNRNPNAHEVSVCKPWLAKQLELLQPEVVVCLGRFAMNYFFPKKKSVLKESGTLIDNKYYIVPHPSYFLRRGGSGYEEYLVELKQVLSDEAASRSTQQTLS